MIPESKQLLRDGGEGGGGERDGNWGVMRGEQWGGDGGGMQLCYCDGAAAHHAAPYQPHQVSGTDAPMFIDDNHGHFLQEQCDIKKWMPYIEPSITAKMLTTPWS
jgi:hypothetical protein